MTNYHLLKLNNKIQYQKSTISLINIKIKKNKKNKKKFKKPFQIQKKLKII